MSDMVSVPAEKIAVLREAAHPHSTQGSWFDNMRFAIDALLDAVETEAEPDELTALREQLARYGEPLNEVYETDGIDIVRKNLRDLRAERDALRERLDKAEEAHRRAVGDRRILAERIRALADDPGIHPKWRKCLLDALGEGGDA